MAEISILAQASCANDFSSSSAEGNQGTGSCLCDFASASKMCCIDLSSRRRSGSDSTGPGDPGTVLALKCPEHPLVALTNPSSAPSSPGADDAALVAFSALARLALPASRLTSTASTVCFQGRAFFALAMKQRVLPPALPGARRPGCALARCCSAPLNVPEELSGPAWDIRRCLPSRCPARCPARSRHVHVNDQL